MRWLRSNIGLGSRLALFALAIQLVSSFGHVHLDKIARSSSQAGIWLAQDRDGAPNRDRHTGANDVCAICAVIGLIASSALPAAALLPPPVVTALASRPEFNSTITASDSHFLFRARAPPVVA